MKQQQEQTEVAAEQAADLAALQAAAAGAAPAPGGAVVEADTGPQPPSAAALQMAGVAVGMLRPIVTYAVPSLRGAPDELWAPVPEGVAAVMDHYGASAEWMQSPWARLAFSLAPLVAFAAVSAMNEKPKAEAAGEVAPQAAADQAPAENLSKTVQIGTAMPAEVLQ